MFEISDRLALMWSAALAALALLFCIVAYQTAFPPLAACTGLCLMSSGRVTYAVARQRWARTGGHGRWSRLID